MKDPNEDENDDDTALPDEEMEIETDN